MNAPETGVFFDTHEYGSFLRRFVSTVVDFVCLFLLVTGWEALVTGPAFDTLEQSEYSAETILWTGAVLLAWGYLAFLKPSRFRTPGYWLTGLRITTLQGRQVPWYQMTYRLLIWAFGPANFLMDALWLYADSAHQSFRDCYAGTLVVRNSAQPILLSQKARAP